MNENKCQELTDLLKGEPLEAFDVREHVFAQVKKDLNEPNNKIKKGKKRNLSATKTYSTNMMAATGS